jgi:hypothetical protein
MLKYIFLIVFSKAKPRDPSGESEEKREGKKS